MDDFFRRFTPRPPAEVVLSARNVLIKTSPRPSECSRPTPVRYYGWFLPRRFPYPRVVSRPRVRNTEFEISSYHVVFPFFTAYTVFSRLLLNSYLFNRYFWLSRLFIHASRHPKPGVRLNIEIFFLYIYTILITRLSLFFRTRFL